MTLVRVLDAPEGYKKELRVKDKTESRWCECAVCGAFVETGEQFVMETLPKPPDPKTGRVPNGFLKGFSHYPSCKG